MRPVVSRRAYACVTTLVTRHVYAGVYVGKGSFVSSCKSHEKNTRALRMKFLKCKNFAASLALTVFMTGVAGSAFAADTSCSSLMPALKAMIRSGEALKNNKSTQKPVLCTLFKRAISASERVIGIADNNSGHCGTDAEDVDGIKATVVKMRGTLSDTCN